MSGVWPFLAVKDVDAAVSFYAAAFGAVERMDRVRSDDGAQVAMLSIDGSTVGVATESAELHTREP